MEFKFKCLDYQKDAAESILAVFNGLDIKNNINDSKTKVGTLKNIIAECNEENIGLKNYEISLSQEDILTNIQEVQQRNCITVSSTLAEGDNELADYNSLHKKYGKCVLDVSMETGTGKTYVYVKTILELYRKYKWNKFIIIVPSVAIREGVFSSIEIMKEHFFKEYKFNQEEKAGFFYFIYKSADAYNNVDTFFQNEYLSIMVINQASFNKESNNIYKIAEETQLSLMDKIAATKPILIFDEEHRLSGKKITSLIENFSALFTLRFSATHKNQNNLIYVLDPVDAYKKRLVKRIEVKGIEVIDPTAQCYIACNKIVSSKNKLTANLTINVIDNNGKIRKKAVNVEKEDDLYIISNKVQSYKGFIVSSIDANTNKVTFDNGVEINVEKENKNEEHSFYRVNIRAQIRETIKSHFEKEKINFKKNIKTLSLFFIDEVAKYRKYDESGKMLPDTLYQKVFDEEYKKIYSKYMNNLKDGDKYKKYLEKLDNTKPDTKVHNGYFSIDKTTKKEINDYDKSTGLSNDVDAYDLILKNKEKLLSFNEPTRFIFSHSALREGWDNPNIFQICTLKNSNNEVAKHQEIGRGLRLCVDSYGTRQDISVLKDDIMKYNTLTVIASESYDDFVKGLQEEISDNLYNKTKVTKELLIERGLSEAEAEKVIKKYTSGAKPYIDNEGNITKEYIKARNNDNIKPINSKKPNDELEKRVKTIFNDIVNEDTVTKGYINKPFQWIENNIKEDMFDADFKGLWDIIKQKYIYKINIDTVTLIKNAADEINKRLNITSAEIIIKKGIQHKDIEKIDIYNNQAFTEGEIERESYKVDKDEFTEYDIVGLIASKTNIKRSTVISILKNIEKEKFQLFQKNPEEFIWKVANIINESKNILASNNVEYIKLENEKYDDSIFETSFQLEHDVKIEDSIYKKLKKNIQVYLVTDSQVERNFAKELEDNKAVKVYSKLPKNYIIPTPAGGYTPDWAVVFDSKDVKYIYFIAETKGQNNKSGIADGPQAKIDAMSKLVKVMNQDYFGNNDAKLGYGVAVTYQDMWNQVKK